MLDEFKRIMSEQTEIALATSVKDFPNVRIVNFHYDPEEKKLFLSSFKDNNKVKEFEENSKVSFTTIPKTNEEHVRVYKAIISGSDKTIFDLKDYFIKKVPSYAEIVKVAGNNLQIFEISFDEAQVTLDYKRSGIVKIKN